MNTIEHALINDQGKAVLLLAPPGIEWPAIHLEKFGTYCGPGHGIGDLLVPDTMWGLKVSAACYVHDFMWAVAEPSWADFHYSNSVFLHNLLRIIDAHGGILKYLRSYRAVTYYAAVDSVAFAKIFWAMKKQDMI